MKTSFIKKLSSRKGAIGIVAIIVFLFVIAAVGASVFYFSVAVSTSNHAELIPHNSFLVYTTVNNPEFNEKWTKAIGKTKEENKEDLTKQLQSVAGLIDIDKFEKVITSFQDAQDAFGRITFAVSNLDLNIKKRMEKLPEGQGFGGYRGKGYKRAIEDEDYVEPPSVPPPPQAEPEEDDEEGYDPTEKPGEEKSEEDKQAIPNDIEGPFPEPQKEERPNSEDDWSDDDWTEKDPGFQSYYTTSEVKMHLDMMMIIEVKDEAKFKEVGKNLEFDMDSAEFKEHQGVKYFEIKMLNFEDIMKQIPDFELSDGKVFACVFGRNLVVANGEANIKNIIDVQKGNAKSLKDNAIAEKRIDWSDDVFCSWVNVNHLINYFANLGDKNSDYKEFQQISKAMKLTDIESMVMKSKSDFSDSFETKYYISSDNKYLKLLNEIPAAKSDVLFADLPKNGHISFAVSMEKGVETIEKIMAEMRKDLPQKLTADMPESIERKDFPENSLHLLQYFGGFINISEDFVSSNLTTIYRLADNANKAEFTKAMNTPYSNYLEKSIFDNRTVYSAVNGEEGIEALKVQLKTPRLNSAVKNLEQNMHALCVIPSPEKLLKMLAGETETMDFETLKTRKDFFVCGLIIEKDGVRFTTDPSFDLLAAITKYSDKIQEKSLGVQQAQMADMYWFEAGTACGTIKAAIDTYKAKNGDDISGLVEFLDEGFVSKSKLLEELKLFEDAFTDLYHFDAEDFSIEFLTDGTDGHYIIKVDASKGKGGFTGQGPKEGTGSYDSKTNKWTGKLLIYANSGLSDLPRYEEPPSIPPPPKMPLPKVELKGSYNWTEAKTAVGTMKAALDTYRAKMNGDISGLKDLLDEGFGSGSELMKKLRLDDSAFENMHYFDAEDFSVEFVTNGKNEYYIINVDASKGVGGMSGKGPKEGIGSYNSKTGEWTGMLK